MVSISRTLVARASRVCTRLALVGGALLLITAATRAAGITRSEWEAVQKHFAACVEMPEAGAEQREAKAAAFLKLANDGVRWWTSPASEEPPSRNLASNDKSDRSGNMIVKGGKYYPHFICIYASSEAARLSANPEIQKNARQAVISAVPNDANLLYRLPAVYALAVAAYLQKADAPAELEQALHHLREISVPKELGQNAPKGQEAFLASIDIPKAAIARMMTGYTTLIEGLDERIRNDASLEVTEQNLTDTGARGYLQLRVAVRTLIPISIRPYDPDRQKALNSWITVTSGSRDVPITNVSKGDQGKLQIQWEMLSPFSGKLLRGEVMEGGHPQTLSYALAGDLGLRSAPDATITGAPVLKDWNLVFTGLRAGDRIVVDTGSGERLLDTVQTAPADGQPYSARLSDPLPLKPNAEQTWTLRVRRTVNGADNVVKEWPARLVSETIPRVSGEVRPLGASCAMAFVTVTDFAPVDTISVDGITYPASIRAMSTSAAPDGATAYTYAIPLGSSPAGDVEVEARSQAHRASRAVTLTLAPNHPVTAQERTQAAQALGDGDPLAALAAQDVRDENHPAVKPYLDLAVKDGDPRQPEARAYLARIYDRIMAASPRPDLQRLEPESGRMALIAQRAIPSRNTDRLARVKELKDNRPPAPVTLVAGTGKAVRVAPGVARVQATLEGLGSRTVASLVVGAQELDRTADPAAFDAIVSPVSPAAGGRVTLDLLAPAPDGAQTMALRVSVQQTGAATPMSYDLGAVPVSTGTRADAGKYADTCARLETVAADPDESGADLAPWLQQAAFAEARKNAVRVLAAAGAALDKAGAGQTALSAALQALDLSARTRKRDMAAARLLQPGEADLVKQIGAAVKVTPVFKTAADTPGVLAPDAGLTLTAPPDAGTLLVNGQEITSKPGAAGAYSVAGLSAGNNARLAVRLRLRNDPAWTVDLGSYAVETPVVRTWQFALAKPTSLPLGNAWPVDNDGKANLDDIQLDYSPPEVPWVKTIRWSFVREDDRYGTKGEELPGGSQPVGAGAITIPARTLLRGHWKLNVYGGETPETARSLAIGDTPVNIVGRGVAFVMGIDQYRSASLHNATNDARDLVDKLINEFGYDPENVVYVYGETIKGGSGQVKTNYKSLEDYSPPDDLLVSAAIANAAWKTFTSRIIPDRKPRHILVFYSGHGTSEDGTGGVTLSCLLPAVGDPIRVNAWQKDLDAPLLQVSRETKIEPNTVAFFNACRSPGDTPTSSTLFRTESVDLNAKYIPIFSCDLNQFANDNKIGAKDALTDDAGTIKNTFFGYALKKALTDGKGANTIGEIVPKMVAEMQKLTAMAAEKNAEFNLPTDRQYVTDQTITIGSAILKTPQDLAGYFGSKVLAWPVTAPS